MTGFALSNKQDRRGKTPLFLFFKTAYRVRHECAIVVKFNRMELNGATRKTAETA